MDGTSEQIARAKEYPCKIAELVPRLSESGKIYYSSCATLQRSPLMLMGHNPGGDPQRDGSIASTLESLDRKVGSDYLNENWEGKGPGAEPLQRRVCALFAWLGYDINEIFATNLIFFRSRDAASSDYSRNASVCWKLHAEFIRKEIDPQLIIVFGVSAPSPFDFIWQVAAYPQFIEYPAGHGNWKAREFSGAIEGRVRTVFGLPHLSRYAPVFASPALIRLKKLAVELREKN